MPMPIFQLIIVFIIIGLVLWLVNTYIPMQPAIKNIMNVVVVILMLLWIMSVLVGVRIGR